MTDSKITSETSQDVAGGAGHMIGAGAAVLALSVLLDSATEHYRGSFHNPAMFTPLATASLAVVINGLPLVGVVNQSSGRRFAGHGATALTGAAGLGFHTYDLLRRPGGVTWSNLFYAAPVGAPAALVLAGALGAAADAVRAGNDRIGPVAIGSGRVLAGFAALGIVGTVAETWLLHFRGAFHNPAMLLPVTLPPLAAASLARDALRGREGPATAGLLVATAVLGVIGVGFHAYGVSRAMGGWRNWRQNVFDGPPLPAPPAFTGLAIAALGALAMMRSKRG